MLSFLPTPLLGLFTASLICLNTAFWCSLFLPFMLLKLLPIKSLQTFCARGLIPLAESWVRCNSLILHLTQQTRWDIQGLENLDPQASYLVISNHRSWTDIFVLQHIFKGRIPFLKFFLKKELIWVPLLGLAWWALDFPFMQRYSRAFLEKHPEMRGKDMETTQKYCARYKHYPVSVINFLEGSRFTPAKQKARQSVYQHLLNPKAGGVALTLSSLGDYLQQVLDVTILYPQNPPRNIFWCLLSGRIPEVVVRVRALPVPAGVMGRDYLNDEAFRAEIQDWVNSLWQHKDAQIAALLGRSATEAPTPPHPAVLKA